jgi:hypothetical protein
MSRQETLQRYDNQRNILLLIHSCGDEVYVYPRLKVGVYALSEGGRIEQNGFTPVLSYPFKELSWDGPSDEEFETDLDTLWQTQVWLARERIQRAGCVTNHSLYKLTTEGMFRAYNAEMCLAEAQRASLKRVAADVGNNENSFYDLYVKYASEFDKQAAERIKKMKT